MSTVYYSAYARPAELPDVPPNTLLRFEAGEWGWDTASQARIIVQRVRRDLHTRCDDEQYRETGDCWVWLTGRVDTGVDRLPGTRVRLSALRRALGVTEVP